MQYKTIVLDLLQQNPELHEQLKSQRLLLPTMEQYAGELKESHETWKDRLFAEKPESDPSQIASEAFEIAIKELEDRLLPGSPAAADETLSLDLPMAHLRRHSPPA